jgi:hypothetical protein
MKGKYLYGIINRYTGFNLDGLTTVDNQSLAAVVAEKEVKDYRQLPKAETVKELIRHQQIIEKIMEQLPILPVKFGTILKNEAEVATVLEKGYFFLYNTLQKVEDKIELDLVCFWNEQKAAQMAYQKSKKVRNLQEKITKKKNATVEDKMAVGKLVAGYLIERREKLRNQILKALKKEAVESCSHALADVNMLLNQAFLVKKDRRAAFNNALDQLDSRFSGLLNFRLVGPLPPYSFATLVIDSLDEKEVDRAKGTLGLNGQLSLKKLKQTYNKLAMKFHPDKGGTPLEFEPVTVAYKTLKNFIQNGLVAVSVYKWEER